MQKDYGRNNFKKYPKMLKCWLKAGKKWFEDPNKNLKSRNRFDNVYQIMVFRLFYDTYEDYRIGTQGLFGTIDCKAFLEDYFKIDLTL